VAPDIKLPLMGGKAVTQGLIDEYVIFDYVNKWVAEREAIDSVADFRFTDWPDFEAYLQRADFDYTSKAEKALEKAVAAAEEEGYDIGSQLAVIQQQVDQEQLSAIQQYKDEIISIIEKEIAGRYYYQRGQVQMGLRNDREVQEAIAVLNDPERYRSLLKP
jgi:carboxyl-terminal processing protease